MSSTSARRSTGSASKDLILQAALDLLGREGHEALTVRRVAAEAGCSTIGVYTWFGGKDGLVDAMWIDGFASFGDALRSSIPVPGRLGALRSLARSYRRWGLEHSMHYRVMFLGVVPNYVPSIEAQTVAINAFLVLMDVVHEGIRVGELDGADPDALGLALWAFVHGHVALQVGAAIKPPTLDVSDALETRAFERALDAFIAGLLAMAQQAASGSASGSGAERAPSATPSTTD